MFQNKSSLILIFLLLIFINATIYLFFLRNVDIEEKTKKNKLNEEYFNIIEKQTEKIKNYREIIKSYQKILKDNGNISKNDQKPNEIDNNKNINTILEDDVEDNIIRKDPFVLWSNDFRKLILLIT
jgi:hypothetical protein